MRYAWPLWKKKKYFFAAAAALALAIYFQRGMGPAGSGNRLAQYLWGAVSYCLDMVAAYLPHIITVYVIVIAALVFMEERNPDRTISWLVTLIFFPVVGIALYIFLGPDFKRVQMRRMFRPTRSYPAAESIDWGRASEQVIKMSTLAYRNSSSPICECNITEVLFDGDETFGAITRELRRASRFINIEYYIFHDDELGREVAGILAERSRSGVTVRMTVDGVGSWKLGRPLIKVLHDAGVRVRTFMPVSFPFLHSRVNYRNHRKIIVIDGEVAFTGGLNVGDEYAGRGPMGYWRDTHLMLRGEAVRALNKIFLADWKISSGEDLSADGEAFHPSGGELPEGIPLSPVQIVPSGGEAWRSIRQMYFSMITGAQIRIWITTPYLIPGEAIMEALRTAALSGVDVRILIPLRSDHFLSHWASYSNVEDLLRSGVRIWFYKKGFTHSKTLVMDDDVASVGTANLDNRSLVINFEVQAFIYDESVCERLASQFMKDLADSEECVLQDWERRGVKSKIFESMGRLWSSQV